MTDAVMPPSAPIVSPEGEEEPEPAGPPRLADGVELLGEYRDSGYVEPPLMARRADGGMVQLPPLLYAVAEGIDGRSELADIAAAVSDRIGKRLEPDDVRMLVDEKLAPLGIAVPLNGRAQDQPAAAADPLLALRLRTKVIPDGVVRAGTTMFRPLFLPPLVIALVAGLLAADAWFFLEHGLAQPARQLLHNPVLMLGVILLVAVTAAFHEFGHATGCRYGGAEPGAMGVGIYIIWPAFYTDISDSHRLGRWGRLRADLGGVYFNGILALVTMGVAVATGFEALFVVVLLQQFEIVRQMLPLLRMDGYYVVSDLVGVPDLFGRIKPILVSFLPGTDPDQRVTQLKPWVRVVVTLWVVAVVAFLGFYTVMLLLALPRLVATGWASFWQQWDTARGSLGSSDVADAALAGLQMLILLAPVAGIAYMLWRLLARWWSGWRGLRGRPLARLAMVGTTVAVLSALTWAWWPSPASYEPIRDDERWTLASFTSGLASLVQGERGAFTDGTASGGRPDPATDPGGGTEPSEASPSPSPDPSPSQAPTPSPSATPTPTPSPSASPTPSPLPSPSAT